MYLEVSLLDQTHPHLSSARVCTEEVSILIDWQIVIYLNALPATVDKQLHDVLTRRVVDRTAVIVLRIDILGK